MIVIKPYLFFEGRCDEAIALYQQVLGAELLFLMRFNEMPEKPQPGMLPPGYEDKVMHATLRIGSSEVMVADGILGGGKGFAGFRLSFAVADPAAAERVFAALAEGGTVQMPLTKTFWSPCFGMLTDRFGVGWMLSVDQAPAA